MGLPGTSTFSCGNHRCTEPARSMRYGLYTQHDWPLGSSYEGRYVTTTAPLSTTHFCCWAATILPQVSPWAPNDDIRHAHPCNTRRGKERLTLRLSLKTQIAAHVYNGCIAMPSMRPGGHSRSSLRNDIMANFRAGISRTDTAFHWS